MTDEKFFIGVKALIENGKGEILILNSSPVKKEFARTDKDFWDLPGGKIKKGEQVEAALMREIKEELGVDGKKLEILGIFDASVSRMKVSSMKTPLVLVTYTCTLPDCKFSLNSEHSEYRWVSRKEAKKLLSEKFNKTFIDKL